MTNLYLTFYGDDFTGSTDVLEALVLGGVSTVLFLEPPTPERIAEQYADIQAVGVAGISRTMTPEQMRAELPPIFNALRALNAPLFHYKVCSTFDSAPHIGNIGQAIEIGLNIFESDHVPLMVGAPALKRYVAFGNLFATIDDQTYRLDRHPTMKHHPITPMTEADLRLHLAQQTERKIGLIDMRHLSDASTLQARYAQLVDEETDIVLFDTLTDEHVLTIGRQMWAMRGDKPLFIVGSSGVEFALTAYWRDAKRINAASHIEPAGAVEQIAVVSGSASPPTAAQIHHAIASGFHPIRLDSVDLIDPDMADAARQRALDKAINAVNDGQSVMIFSTIGSDDPAIEATRARMTELGINPNEIGARLGSQQGRLLRELLEQTNLRRVCVAGGDTCGHSARQLDLYALEYRMPIAAGAPLCVARSHNPAFDGLEIALKAGQFGQADYFTRVLNG